MTIEDKILKYIDNHDYVTYRELEVFFENSGIDWKGNLEIYSDVCDNVIFWSGWNEKVVSALYTDHSIRFPVQNGCPFDNRDPT